MSESAASTAVPDQEATTPLLVNQDVGGHDDGDPKAKDDAAAAAPEDHEQGDDIESKLMPSAGVSGEDALKMRFLRKPTLPEHHAEIAKYETSLGRKLDDNEVDRVVKWYDIEHPPSMKPSTEAHFDAIRAWEAKLGQKLTEEEVDRVLRNLTRGKGGDGTKYKLRFNSPHFFRTVVLLVAELLMVLFLTDFDTSGSVPPLVVLFAFGAWQFFWCCQMQESRLVKRICKMKEPEASSDEAAKPASLWDKLKIPQKWVCPVVWTIVTTSLFCAISENQHFTYHSSSNVFESSLRKSGTGMLVYSKSGN
mmetsp:Transcript_5028/g.14657  ORF Transcript_5028/g.14657 Transcript_5028/m.14657 type:complete len:307 (-) Transcript_5028:4933-5853(-)